MTADKDQFAISEIYKLAIAARDLEIDRLIQRNNFFMIFQGVLLAGLLQASGNGKIIPTVSFLVCSAGLLASIFQVGMASGAKFWQERWEHAVETAEEYLLTHLEGDKDRKDVYEIFSTGNEHINSVVKNRIKCGPINSLICRRYSPSRIPIYTGIMFMFIWALLLAAQVSGPFTLPSWIIGFKSC